MKCGSHTKNRAVVVAVMIGFFAASGPCRGASPDRRVVWEWNDQTLAAVRADRARPTVQARTLFHVSAAMFDAWAVYDPHAAGYLVHEKHDLAAGDAARSEAISYAAYTLLRWRYARSPGSNHTLTALDGAMERLGLATGDLTAEGNDPRSVGIRVASVYISLASADGAREVGNYLEEPRHVPVNKALDTMFPGTTLSEPDRWQPLVVDGATQRFITPHWGSVKPFALPIGPERFAGLDVVPPMILNQRLEELRAQLVELIRHGSLMDFSNGDLLDISPGVIGNNSLGSDDGRGHALNPVTGRPYPANMVRAGDYRRAVADYWSDGPGSDTPPGHWNAIAQRVARDPHRVPTIAGRWPVRDDTEWDVKLLFALNAALHDAAIASWDLKHRYDTVRPISIIRWMAANGQSTDPALPSFHQHGLPLIEGLIELITPATTADGLPHAHLRGHEGKIAIKAWAGPPRPPDVAAGVEWILGERWMPFQPWDFTTPPFPAYTSGHSTFSRAAAEVLARFTGSAYFPGGLLEVTIPAQAGLRVERGPEQPVTLQWATYFDASDQSGLSRRLGGIHIWADDRDGRIVGARVGEAAFNRAIESFGSR
jgi:hypothetical protein